MKINSKENRLPLIRLITNSAGRNKGFTLVELIMVMALIGVLAVIASTGFNNYREKAKLARATEEIRGLEKDILAYATEKGGAFPDSLDQIGRASQLDPWGNPYVYSLTLRRSRSGFLINSDFDLYSMGPKGTSADSVLSDEGLDDIVRADSGAFAGTVEFFLKP